MTPEYDICIIDDEGTQRRHRPVCAGVAVASLGLHPDLVSPPLATTAVFCTGITGQVRQGGDNFDNLKILKWLQCKISLFIKKLPEF